MNYCTISFLTHHLEINVEKMYAQGILSSKLRVTCARTARKAPGVTVHQLLFHVQVTGGYYADVEAECQLFHVCVQVSDYEVRRRNLCLLPCAFYLLPPIYFLLTPYNLLFLCNFLPFSSFLLIFYYLIFFVHYMYKSVI